LYSAAQGKGTPKVLSLKSLWASESNSLDTNSIEKYATGCNAMKTFSTQEVANDVGIHPVTLRRWLAAKKIRPSIAIPTDGQTLYRWTRADVKRLRRFKEAHYGKGRGPRKKSANR
jgi:MerR HTH family regulatory protein